VRGVVCRPVHELRIDGHFHEHRARITGGVGDTTAAWAVARERCDVLDSLPIGAADTAVEMIVEANEHVAAGHVDDVDLLAREPAELRV
jgi:hypothetical protein